MSASPRLVGSATAAAEPADQFVHELLPPQQIFSASADGDAVHTVRPACR